MSSRIRILIADDHPIVRDGLVAILGTQPDFEVIGEAVDGTQLVEYAAKWQPDVVLTDLEMPGLDGVEAIKRIHSQIPAVRMIVLTVFDTDDRIISSIQAGAQGYLLKGAPRSEIFAAIRAVNAGGSLLHPIAITKLLERLRTGAPEVEALTEREMEVLRLLVLGHTNREIGEKLNITERTVKFHVSAINGKLGASNRTEAVSIALQRGLVGH
jgi:DNA-binding NarL/FixJ family response regulator